MFWISNASAYMSTLVQQLHTQYGFYLERTLCYKSDLID